MERLLERYSPYLYATMRVVVGFLFACHGAEKLFAVLGGVGRTGAAAPLFSLMWFAGVVELTAGLLVMVGWFTKYVAFVASGEMAFAYFMVHARKGFWPILNGGELAVLYCFIFLFIAAHGARVCSLDTLLERSRSVGPLRRMRSGAL
jgi:putative oxidoreductase